NPGDVLAWCWEGGTEDRLAGEKWLAEFKEMEKRRKKQRRDRKRHVSEAVPSVQARGIPAAWHLAQLQQISQARNSEERDAARVEDAKNLADRGDAGAEMVSDGWLRKDGMPYVFHSTSGNPGSSGFYLFRDLFPSNEANRAIAAAELGYKSMARNYARLAH